MSEEQMLRERLTRVTVPASRIDMVQVLPAARRRVFRKRLATGIGAAVLSVAAVAAVPVFLPDGNRAAPATAPAAPKPVVAKPAATCKVTELPDGGVKADDLAPVRTDSSGRFIVGNYSEGQDFRPVLWTDGKAEKLPMLSDSLQATDVNSHGVVVALTTVNKPLREGVARYADGRWTELKLPAGNWNPYPEPRINDRGDVVINIKPEGSSGDKTSTLLWPAGATDAVEVEVPEAAEVADVTEEGDLVGTMRKSDDKDEAWVWKADGTGRQLEKPKGKQVTGYAARHDWVVGGIWPDENAVVWNTKTGKRTKIPADSPASAVNAKGWVASMSGQLWIDGKKVDLDGGQAKDLSDGEFVVGTRNSRPVTWTC